MAAALNVSPAANIFVPGKKRESLPIVVVLPVPFTPNIRMTVGVCETSSSTGPSSMLVACSIMSSRNSAPLVMFLSSASCAGGTREEHHERCRVAGAHDRARHQHARGACRARRLAHAYGHPDVRGERDRQDDDNR